MHLSGHQGIRHLGRPERTSYFSNRCCWQVAGGLESAPQESRARWAPHRRHLDSSGTCLCQLHPSTPPYLVTVMFPQLRLVWAAPVGSPPPAYSVVGQSQLGPELACTTARRLVTEQPGQGPGECGVAEGAVCYSNTCCGDLYVAPANASVQYRICGTGRVACQVGRGGGARKHARDVVACSTLSLIMGCMLGPFESRTAGHVKPWYVYTGCCLRADVHLPPRCPLRQVYRFAPANQYPCFHYMALRTSAPSLMATICNMHRNTSPWPTCLQTNCILGYGLCGTLPESSAVQFVRTSPRSNVSRAYYVQLESELNYTEALGSCG